MFEHEHHKKILLILQSLNALVFDEVGAFFGGGTLISLLHGEYRWSKDVDFICSTGPGYRRLRELVADAMFKPSVLFSKTELLSFPRDIMANQYGIRFLVIADGVPVKFEIVAESRLTLNAPDRLDWISVPCLNFDDQCAEKLLANADRWLDTGVESRDLIDLAVLRLQEKIPQAAIDKAEAAYPVLSALNRAIEQFQGSARYREKCFLALEIEKRSLIIDGIDLLALDFGMKKTERSIGE